jgi:magnesium transporter
MSETGLEALTLAFLRTHPRDAALMLESAPFEEALRLLGSVPARIAAPVLEQLPPGAAAQILLGLDVEQADALLTPLSTQSRVQILRHVPEAQRARFLEGLPAHLAVAARLLLGYPDDSVGSQADPDVVTADVALLVRDALELLRHAAPRVDRIFAIDGRGRLVGWVRLPALLRAAPTTPLSASLVEDSALLPAASPLSGARAHPGWLEDSTLPVVDRGRRLVGVLTRDALERSVRDVRRAAQDNDDASMPEVLARAWWQSVSGITQALLPLLPRTPRIAELGDDER